MEALDRAILTTLEQDVLHPAVISKAVEKALQQLRPQDDDPALRRQMMQKELAKVEGCIGSAHARRGRRWKAVHAARRNQEA